MAALRGQRARLLLGAIFVFALALQQNFSRIDASPFHPDESRWLNRAHYTTDLFHPLSDVWDDSYLIRGQPPGGSFITGIGLLLQGRDLHTNGAWDFHFGNETITWWNAARGNMPSWDDLVAARRTSAFLGAITALAVFLIVVQITNVAGGVVAGSFIAVHPLSVYLSTIGVSDAAFTCLVSLTTLAGMALARSPSWPRTLVLGLLLGFGTSTKLSPIAIAVLLAGVGIAFAATPVLQRIPAVRSLLKLVPGTESSNVARLSWKLVTLPLIAGFYFVLTYPYLWPAPLARTRYLFEFRRDEMENQARIWPDSAVSSRLNALDRTWKMLENRYSASDRLFGISFDVPVAVVGLAILLVLAWRRGIVSPTAAAVLLCGAQGALILGGLRVDFDRYYLPIVFAFAIGIGVTASFAWSLAVMAVAKIRARDSREIALPRRETTHLPSGQNA